MNDAPFPHVPRATSPLAGGKPRAIDRTPRDLATLARRAYHEIRRREAVADQQTYTLSPRAAARWRWRLFVREEWRLLVGIVIAWIITAAVCLVVLRLVSARFIGI